MRARNPNMYIPDAVEEVVSRALAKKPVMTYVYGATLRGTAEHIETVLGKEVLPAAGEKWLDDGKTFEHCMYIAKKLFQGIAAAVPAAASLSRCWALWWSWAGPFPAFTVCSPMNRALSCALAPSATPPSPA